MTWTWDGNSLHIFVENEGYVTTRTINSDDLRSPEFDLLKIVESLNKEADEPISSERSQEAA